MWIKSRYFAIHTFCTHLVSENKLLHGETSIDENKKKAGQNTLEINLQGYF